MNNNSNESKEKGLNFGEALELLEEGLIVRRAKWDKGKHIFLETNPGDSGIWCTDNGRVQFGWLANQEDTLSEDWEIVEF